MSCLSADLKMHALSFLGPSDTIVLLSVNQSWIKFRESERCSRLLYQLFFGALNARDTKLFAFAPESTWSSRFKARVQTRLNMMKWQPSRITTAESLDRVATHIEPEFEVSCFDDRVFVSRPGVRSISVKINVGWTDYGYWVDNPRSLVILSCQNKDHYGIWTIDGEQVTQFQDASYASNHMLRFDGGELFICFDDRIDVIDYLDAKRPVLRSFAHPMDYLQSVVMQFTKDNIVLTYGAVAEEDKELLTGLNSHTILLRRSDLKVLDRLGCAAVACSAVDQKTFIVEDGDLQLGQFARLWIVDRGSFVQIPVPKWPKHNTFVHTEAYNARCLIARHHHTSNAAGAKYTIYDFMPVVKSSNGNRGQQATKRQIKRQRTR